MRKNKLYKTIKKFNKLIKKSNKKDKIKFNIQITIKMVKLNKNNRLSNNN